MKRTILSLGVVAAMAANTYASGFGWYTAVATTPNASVVSSGPGQTLQLACDKSQGGCGWNVTLNYTANDGGGAGWALDLNGDPTKLSITNPVSTVNPLASFSQSNGAPGAVFGGGITDPSWLNGDAGGVAQAPLAGATANLTLQTFHLNAAGISGIGLYNIMTEIGGGSWGGNDNADGSETVSIGPNAPVPGTPTGELLPLPVISVVNTPEPATLSMIGLGLLALARRRK